MKRFIADPMRWLHEESTMFAVTAGSPFWRFLARHGAAVRVTVSVLHDREAGVFVANSPNVQGLVAEAPTLEELKSEIDLALDVLLSEQIEKKPRPPVLIWGDTASACA